MFFTQPIIEVQILIQFITVIGCLYYYKVNQNSKIVLLLSLISFLSFLVECIGVYCIKTGNPSLIFHYVYLILNFSLIIFLYSKLISDSSWIRFIKFYMVIFYSFGIYTFLNLYLITYLFTIGGIGVAVSIFFYLRQLLLSDKILNYKRLVSFWVSVGFLVFYLPSIPFFSLFKYMQNRGLFFLINILVILMNLFIIFGLVCANKKEKYS